MPNLNVEYRDASGRKHKVSSIDKVPKKYLQSMEVTAEYEPEAQQEGGKPVKTSSGKLPNDHFSPPSLPKSLADINPLHALAVALVLVMWRVKSFFGRAAALTVIALCGFYLLYGWFEGSDYMKTSDRKPRVTQQDEDPYR